MFLLVMEHDGGHGGLRRTFSRTRNENQMENQISGASYDSLWQTLAENNLMDTCCQQLTRATKKANILTMFVMSTNVW